MSEQIIFSMAGVSKVIPPNRQILKNIYLSFFYGAKIGVLGLNGSGKSTLLRVIAGIDKSINGEVVFSSGYSVGMLEQEPKLDPNKTVKEVVEEGVQEIVDLLKEFDQINEAFGDPDADFDKLMERQGNVQEKLDAFDAWELDSRLERAMDALRCPPSDAKIGTLSGGEKRRVALTRLLLQEPDVLLLDEPTNHLDIDMREALAEALSDFEGAIVLVSHDRHLIGLVSETYWRVADGNVDPFNGDLDEYAIWLKARGNKIDQASSKARQEAAKPKVAPKSTAELSKLQKQVDKLEKLMAEVDSQLAHIQEEMAKPELYQSDGGAVLLQLGQQQHKLEAERAKAENEWLEAYQALELS